MVLGHLCPRLVTFVVTLFLPVNIDNKIGAVGFVPLCAGSLYPVALLKVDEETGEPVRGTDGLCMRCEPGKKT